MAVTLEKHDAGSRIALDGTVDITAALELKTALLDALGAGAPVAVSLGAVSYLDVTATQLLWAARRAAKDAGVAFTAEDSVPESISKALKEAGFAVPAVE